MFGPADQGQGVGVGVGATGPARSFVELLVPFACPNALENAPVPNSATATPARQTTAAVKTRRLKKADREVDFFFMADLSSLINYDVAAI
jgi:hypothetical protein